MDARGSGKIIYEPNVQDKVEEALAKWKRNPNDTAADVFERAGWEYDIREDGCCVGLFFEYGRFSDQAEDLLDAIAPFVEWGHIEITNEYDDNWQFAFVDGKVEEFCGVITYPGSPYADPDL